MMLTEKLFSQAQIKFKGLAIGHDPSTPNIPCFQNIPHQAAFGDANIGSISIWMPFPFTPQIAHIHPLLSTAA